MATVTVSPHSALLGKAVLLERRIGKGRVLLLGATPGRATMRKLLSYAMDAAGIAHGFGDGDAVIVSPRHGDEGNGVFLVEYAGKGGRVTLPKAGTDILTGETFSCDVQLAPYQVRAVKFG